MGIPLRQQTACFHGFVVDIRTKRAWDRHEASDGARFLVDGRWPPGVRPDSLRIVLWVRDAAPGGKLMKWFRRHPDEWPEFKRRYFDELDADPVGWEPIARQARLGPVTLLYAMRDRRHNNAAALAEYLTDRISAG
ncbi:MAG: DUF488 family protein [Acidimicrobiia bacterium]|nr:DUF488 family protein [Acidimicrobiia bacterium]NNL97537.1 DUF488 family protein [Acidimicrobiia bacterium]RZV43829.1 MAG: DUF488 family protein [Acidimicrobiia bacterium]